MKKNFRIFVYSDYPCASLNIDIVQERINELGFPLEDRGNLIDFLSLSEQSIYKLGQDLSSVQIPDISIPVNSANPPDRNEITSEVNRILGRESAAGKFYDGFWIQRILYRALAEKVADEIKSGFIHLIFTSRLFGTFENRRYHARVVLMGTPALISTSGLVEAPAKPKEYYYIKGRLIQSGIDLSELDNMYKGRFVEYDDPNISSILPSYALQAVGYEITGNAFCEDPDCCLFNSHWQEDVLKVQYNGNPCEKCMELIRGK